MASMKSVLITGCSAGGIGEALARSFQKRGYLVFATARNTSKIPAGLLSLPNVEKIALDVTSLESIAAAVEIVSKRTNGTLDVLVNNSGSGLTAPGLDTDLEKAKAMYDVNFWGVLSMVQKFSPLVVKAKGTIVNLSSVVGEMHAGYFSIYGSSKAALTQASETWRLELAPLGVRVITVITGIIESNFFNNTPEYHTPEGSFYKSVEKNIQDVEKTIPKATPANEFADSVVSAVAAGTSGKLFAGSLSVPMKYLTTYAPNFVLDKVFSDKRGFETLAKEVRV